MGVLLRGHAHMHIIYNSLRGNANHTNNSSTKKITKEILEIIKLGKKKEARPKPETLGGTMGGGAGENGDCGETVTQRIEKKKIYHKKIKKMYNLVLKIKIRKTD